VTGSAFKFPSRLGLARRQTLAWKGSQRARRQQLSRELFPPRDIGGFKTTPRHRPRTGYDKPPSVGSTRRAGVAKAFLLILPMRWLPALDAQMLSAQEWLNTASPKTLRQVVRTALVFCICSKSLPALDLKVRLDTSLVGITSDIATLVTSMPRLAHAKRRAVLRLNSAVYTDCLRCHFESTRYQVPDSNT